MSNEESVEVSSPLPLLEVRSRLAAGLVPAWRIALPEGRIIGAVTDARVRAHLPSTGRRFPAVLDATLAPAGRGCLIRGRIRRNAASAALVIALGLLELLLIAASVAAAASGTPVALVAPVAFLAALAPFAIRARRLPPDDVAALKAWLHACVAADVQAGSGDAAAGPLA